jgi:crotonobetainyl-CoA:carnitine CoA-transferase CaiB-like acyl-CoA transferase
MLPLTGTTILDLSQLLPGPFRTWILAEFGADVLKVELDVTRCPFRGLIACCRRRGWQGSQSGDRVHPGKEIPSGY